MSVTTPKNQFQIFPHFPKFKIIAHMIELKINELCNQIVPIPIQISNCIESVWLREEILVNSDKNQNFAQPLIGIFFLNTSSNLIYKHFTVFWNFQSM